MEICQEIFSTVEETREKSVGILTKVTEVNVDRKYVMGMSEEGRV